MTEFGAMETLDELVARERRSDATALLASGAQQTYDYRRFCTTVWKTANFLHARGVRERATVAVADDPRAEPVIAVLASAILGAKSYVDPGIEVDDRVLVAHVDDIEEYDVAAGTQVIAYGGEPTAPDVYHFEGDVWSENPTIPPEAADRSPMNVALVSGYEARTHGELLDAAVGVADDAPLDADTRVVVRAPLADPRTLVAGVIAPLGVGGTIVFPESGAGGGTADGAGEPEEAVGDVAIVGPGTTAPEPRSFAVRDVEF